MAESDIYTLARQAGLRIQTLTALPEDLAESILFGVEKGAFTGATESRAGLFQTDHPIDIFLDEIGDATPSVQAKLLEVLETKTYRPLGLSFERNSKHTEARIIVATNQDLTILIEKGAFRPDLYDRLSWVSIRLPPLREQLDQLPVLITRMSNVLRTKHDLSLRLEPSSRDMAYCGTYHWPGNHRQLYQVLWDWYFHDGKKSIKDIIVERSAKNVTGKGLGEFILDKLFARFDDILAGVMPGFRTYGEISVELRQSFYKAIYLYNRHHRLKDDDLRILFKEQAPSNVRRQISQNRPSDEIW